MTVKKALYSQIGDPALVLALKNAEPTALAADQVRIKVLRSPINPADLMQISGTYPLHLSLPAVAGSEGIGRISERGSGVAGLKVGQLVQLPGGTGCWQSETVVSARGLTPLPDADLDQLSMITINPPTAFLLLSDIKELSPGDWILQNAGNSAVSRYVIQLAKMRGIKTVSVVRRTDVVAELETLGGDVVLLDGDDLAARVSKATGGAVIGLGFDAVGGTASGRLATCLGRGGTLVSYGAMSGEPVQISQMSTIANDVTLRGFWLAPWFCVSTPARCKEVFCEILALIVAGELSVPVDQVFALEDLDQALARASQGGRNGKVLLAPNGV
ncbi:zinc-dependent alcohol dehydrogenase family protein [Candidatus Halocynthiibacter alkanivorans]|uniref:zinc-dependent alcohol dehydrogenase family protein n=1 Tax=Candidatus Halocynthiibacter alkanivorans TaxID=2267619 RepID=UPI000DF46009|nr:zinc-dependent alcohol dehydrogenase family protein [Candidatus Halocynthiibacter alkanivorans]